MHLQCVSNPHSTTLCNVHLYSIQFNVAWGEVNIIHTVVSFLGMENRREGLYISLFYSFLFSSVLMATGVFLWPEASLISRAVRMRAIRVEVKWTVLSSAMGMFILTRRWGEETSGDKETLDHWLTANEPDQNIQFTQRNQSVCCCDPMPSMDGFTLVASSTLKMLSQILLNTCKFSRIGKMLLRLSTAHKKPSLQVRTEETN